MHITNRTHGAWTVTRWGGTDRHPPRVIFAGDEAKARERYARAAGAMRQGWVELADDKGVLRLRDWAPNLRTRW